MQNVSSMFDNVLNTFWVLNMPWFWIYVSHNIRKPFFKKYRKVLFLENQKSFFWENIRNFFKTGFLGKNIRNVLGKNFEVWGWKVDWVAAYFTTVFCMSILHFDLSWIEQQYRRKKINWTRDCCFLKFNSSDLHYAKNSMGSRLNIKYLFILFCETSLLWLLI